MKTSQFKNLSRFFLITFFTVFRSFADDTPISPTYWPMQLNEPQYISGTALRDPSNIKYISDDMQKCLPDDDKGDHGFVTVPLDYSKPNAGTLSVYYHLDRKWNPALPSVIFFTGGPGDGSACFGLGNSLPEYNVIMFDQRGIGFSRPNSLNDLMNFNNFSTLTTAKDAAAILDHLGVKTVSVWGHSYGTVAATEFSSTFPERAKATILEGTVFSADNLFEGPHRIKLLQFYFNHLTPARQSQVLSLSSSNLTADSWFSDLAVSFLETPTYDAASGHNQNAFLRLDKALDSIFANPTPEAQASYLAATYSISANATENSSILVDILQFSQTTYLQIGCRELNFYGPHSTFSAVFKGNVLVPKDDTQGNLCDKIAGMHDTPKTPYESTQYPIATPVTYFQGVLDGQTPADNAIRHYKQVSKGNKQLILFRNEEHGPVVYHLGYKNLMGIQTDTKASALHDIALQALNGQKMTTELLQEASDMAKATGDGVTGDLTYLSFTSQWK